MEEKKIEIEYGENARILRNKMNELGITKDRIIAIVFNGQYVVFYE